MLTYKGKVATTFFFASSGGRTANVQDIWSGSPIPYLVAVDDPGDTISPYHRWKPQTFTATGLGKLFGTGPVRTISIVRNKSGRVGTLTLTSSRGLKTLRGSEARTRGALRSTWFSLRLLDLQRATRTSKGVHVLGRSSPDGKVGLEGFVDGAWVRLKTVLVEEGPCAFDVATRARQSCDCVRATPARDRLRAVNQSSAAAPANVRSLLLAGNRTYSCVFRDEFRRLNDQHLVAASTGDWTTRSNQLSSRSAGNRAGSALESPTKTAGAGTPCSTTAPAR